MRSHALMAGMTFEVLAQQLGHKDTRITMRHYAHLCPTFKQESVRHNAPSVGFGTASDPSDGSSRAQVPADAKRAVWCRLKRGFRELEGSQGQPHKRNHCYAGCYKAESLRYMTLFKQVFSESYLLLQFDFNFGVGLCVVLR